MHRTVQAALGVVMVATACTERVAGPPETKEPPARVATTSIRQPVTRPLPAGCAPATTLVPEEGPSPYPYPVWREAPPEMFEEPTTLAELLQPVVPDYTPLAREARISGIVILEVLVSAEGVPLGARVLKGLPCGLEAEAKQAVSNAKFRPAKRGERPIDSLLNVPVHFRPPVQP